MKTWEQNDEWKGELPYYSTIKWINNVFCFFSVFIQIRRIRGWVGEAGNKWVECATLGNLSYNLLSPNNLAPNSCESQQQHRVEDSTWEMSLLLFLLIHHCWLLNCKSGLASKVTFRCFVVLRKGKWMLFYLDRHDNIVKPPAFRYTEVHCF